MDAWCYHYRHAPIGELPLADAAAWLTPREEGELARYRDGTRRDAWLAGRLVVKQLLIERLARLGNMGVRPRELEIASRDAAGQMVRPQASWRGRLLEWPLSIAHSQRAVLAAVAGPGMAIGVDLAPVGGALGRGFEELWFAPDECRGLDVAPQERLAAAWGAKEAAYKALNRGERFAPRDVRVEPHPGGGIGCRFGQKAAHCRITFWRTPCHELAVLATYSLTTREQQTQPR